MIKSVHIGPYTGSRIVTEYIKKAEQRPDISFVLVDGYRNTVKTWSPNHTTTVPYELIEDGYEPPSL